MLPLVDAHVHLLGGLDDGARDVEHALQMCRIAVGEGTRLAAAVAHQNDHWPNVTPARIRTATQELSHALLTANLELAVSPCAEVMVRFDLCDAVVRGELMTVGDHGQFMLLEMPHDLFVDIRGLIRELRGLGLRAILAHPERTPAMLHNPGAIEELIELGCLVQASAKSITEPQNRHDERAIRDWVKRGVVHMLGSDGHSTQRRAPLLLGAVQQIRRWAGQSTADRIGSTIGQLVLRGSPVNAPRPANAPRRWWALPW